MTEPRPTNLLVERALDGERSAFDELFKAFEDRIRSFIRSRLLPGYAARLDVDDILQDTWVRSFQSIGSFKGNDPDGFRRWLTGVANKAVLRARDRLFRHKSLEIQNDVVADEISPGKAMRRQERFDRLQQALDSLTGDHRQVIFLTRIEGLTLKQTAEKMGRSSEAVRKLFWRALQRLRSTLSNTVSLHLPDQAMQWKEGDDAGR